MPTYIVINKATQAEVHKYNGESPVEWAGMEFATHDHVESAEPPVDLPVTVDRRLTKLQFIDRLGDTAYVAILRMARDSTEVEAFVKRLDLATPDPDGTSVDLDDPRTVTGVTMLGAVLEMNGVVQAGWSQGVLNG